MITARHLNPNDCIGIFSPSEPVVDYRVDKLSHGLQILQNNGFRTRLGQNVYIHTNYTAGNIQERVEDLKTLIEDNDVSALMASWGGKSCNQLLPYIDYNAIKEARKAILAFSDGCVLLNAITSTTNLITFHGPNIVGKLSDTKHSNLELLVKDFNQAKVNILGDVNSINPIVVKKGRSQGRLFGGNLSTFTLGNIVSKYMPKFEHGIFFWESGEEPIQIIDQYLTCLKNAGLFENLRGMIIGDFIFDDSEVKSFKKRDPFEMIENLIQGYNFPVVYCPTFGHKSNLENPIFPIGSFCELDAESMSLYLLESCIS